VSMAFITDEMARGMAEQMRQRATADPLFAEDCESISESMPFVVRMAEGTRPITCECCGVLVTAVPEADTRSGRPWRWECAIWEAETARKHTLRRCNWKREHTG